MALLNAEIQARLVELREGEMPIAGKELRPAVDEVVRNQRTWDWTTMEKHLEELSGLAYAAKHVPVEAAIWCMSASCP